MRYVFIGLAVMVIGLTWLVASAQTLKGPGRPLPPVDSAVTSNTETATFALG
jgi:hypothetical protein